MSKQSIWDYLKPYINNDYGLAGLMGNMAAESGFISYIRQGDVPVSSVSVQYTADVDNGTKTRAQFINDGYGYGLSQWTYPTRKAALYDYWQSSGATSIGDEEMQLNFLLDELQNSFPLVWAELTQASSIAEAAVYYMKYYESPQDQSTSAKNYRISLAVQAYNDCSGESPEPTPHLLPQWLFFKFRRCI